MKYFVGALKSSYNVVVYYFISLCSIKCDHPGIVTRCTMSLNCFACVYKIEGKVIEQKQCWIVNKICLSLFHCLVFFRGYESTEMVYSILTENADNIKTLLLIAVQHSSTHPSVLPLSLVVHLFFSITSTKLPHNKDAFQ